MSIHKFLFCTGVKAKDSNSIEGEVSPNGVMMIPFYCNNVPENAVFKYASDSKLDNNLHRAEIVKGGLLSKYAYFAITKEVA